MASIPGGFGRTPIYPVLFLSSYMYYGQSKLIPARNICFKIHSSIKIVTTSYSAAWIFLDSSLDHFDLGVERINFSLLSNKRQLYERQVNDGKFSTIPDAIADKARWFSLQWMLISS